MKELYDINQEFCNEMQDSETVALNGPITAFSDGYIPTPQIIQWEMEDAWRYTKQKNRNYDKNVIWR